MTPEYWQDACTHLSKRCKVMKKLIKAYPEAQLRTRGDPFQTLARAIVGQQISVKAAQSVWDRTVLVTGRITPKNMLAVTPEQLREAGNSRQKISYMQDLAAHFADGRIKPRRWHKHGRRGRDRRTGRSQRHRPLDGGDVPDFLSDATKCVSGR